MNDHGVFECVVAILWQNDHVGTAIIQPILQVSQAREENMVGNSISMLEIIWRNNYILQYNRKLSVRFYNDRNH